MDWSLLMFGVALVAISYSGYRRPERDVKGVVGWQKRLSELKAGADEKYFEERRQLEAYPPPKHMTANKLKRVSMLGMSLGLAFILAAIFR
ncbi:hypothetical protein F7D01_02010 [Erythrobacter sp. 3-20A1M]|uniref:hypothetical protein n=1 Tax=Erythrobacter sp. 3-20A1M TaxID=2653850 RepID=UPI001BFBF7FF|nr:hypothetical protein [Erythrobacter sp. 3-20A1M]QWC56036.1 hypothetical protein F7D01_02010 [Erythrobacter sp. 3-20A1M]